MIPDFPAAKKFLHKLLTHFMKDKVDENTPLATSVTRRILFEGDSLSVIRADGSHHHGAMTKAESTLAISEEELGSLTNEDFLDKMSASAGDMARIIEKGLIDTLDAVTREAGNTLNIGGQLTPDALLSTLERLPIAFENDDRSKPEVPFMLTHPEVLKQLKQMHDQMPQEQRDALEARRQRILDLKYKEHLSDLNARMLTDEEE